MTSLPEKPPSPQAADKEADFIPLSPEHRPGSSHTDREPGETSEPASPLQDPPLPSEEPPPLPKEQPPSEIEDDGWDAVWDPSSQAFYFYNRTTQVTQWENPRLPETAAAVADTGPPGAPPKKHARPAVGGYNPAIHGDYDPNADYAKADDEPQGFIGEVTSGTADAAQTYAATGAFNRFTGKWQVAELNPDKFSDENKSHRQMNAYFDVDAAANSHDGRSLKAERSNKKLSKKDLKAFKEKRREKKEEKRRAWLRD